MIGCFGFSQEAGMLTQAEYGGRGGVVDIIGNLMRGHLASSIVQASYLVYKMISLGVHFMRGYRRVGCICSRPPYTRL